MRGHHSSRLVLRLRSSAELPNCEQALLALDETKQVERSAPRLAEECGTGMDHLQRRLSLVSYASPDLKLQNHLNGRSQ